MPHNPNAHLRWRSYLSNLALIWFTIWLCRALPYYKGFLLAETQQVLVVLALAYTFGMLPFYVFAPDRMIKESKSAVLLRVLLAFLLQSAKLIWERKYALLFRQRKLQREEKTAILFVIVKFIYIPMMVNFCFLNLHKMDAALQTQISSGFFSFEYFDEITLTFAAGVIYFIDTFIFAFAYTIEAGFLGNKVKSVEPTLLGWVVTLACYPPLSYASGSLIALFPIYSGPSNLMVFVVGLLFFLSALVYLWSTIALGFKASNLTNRGIVSAGPYAFVRHPAYIMKALGWWVYAIPSIVYVLSPLRSIILIASLVSWSFIYYLRAYTEERHLLQDPDYVKYRKKVKYMFIPGVF
ncbi:DUF1295 domain-containing protein [Candidatus Woesearchaeota archaeon]|nr:DUF1295 domain-containing protein [Candidatus Woesearchaeota archaeon]